MVSQQPTELPSNPERRSFLQYSLGTLFGLTTLAALGVHGCLMGRKELALRPIKPLWENIKNHEGEGEPYYFGSVENALIDINFKLKREKYSWTDIASVQERKATLIPIVKKYRGWLASLPDTPNKPKQGPFEVVRLPEATIISIWEQMAHLPHGSLRENGNQNGD
ncbi:MAG TPA: hypothetical protein VI873_02345 [Candidatus Peribacteraceae bacterium]|nr:hypothetical protein [Candidatus Peribacteraceae bacterium]